ncbi:MAG: shikimate dehydrogenase [Ruminococcus sp.]|nr:shikimate dehydrogenase [Ruminococcus sp.]MBQ3988059.1 shikimate dehydrogenase [Ruminococcus sp.]
MQRKYALLGGKLGHTLSPPIHKRLFELKSREFEYTLIESEPEQLDGKKGELSALAGYNVTIPHKQSVIAFMDRLDDSAKRYGAVNCVDNKGGASVGYNTDCDGFLRSVRAEGGRLDGSVLLLGAGGVGRMMAIEACLAGGRLTMAVLESFMEQTQKVREDILALVPSAQVRIVSIGNIPDEHFDTLINATPVGMYPKCDACAVTDEVIANADFVFDAIYNPKETLLIQKAKAMGKKAVGGMAMLVWQAVSAHEIWDGDSYTDEQVQAIIDEMYQKVERDFK